MGGIPVPNGYIDDPVSMAGIGWAGVCVFTGCMLCSLSAIAVGEDEYLNQIQDEAYKVEANSADNTAADEAKVDKDTFDKELQASYRGSYLFYQKLPQRSQEEIFADYAKGASIADIRKKILDRFLHGK